MENENQQAIHNTANELVDALVAQCDRQKLCPHCVGLDVIYMLALDDNIAEMDPNSKQLLSVFGFVSVSPRSVALDVYSALNRERVPVSSSRIILL